MKATKANKEYTIDESMKAQYVKDGFDIYDDSGKLIDYGAGKTVPYGDYIAVVKALEELKTAGKDPEQETPAEETAKRGRGAKA